MTFEYNRNPYDRNSGWVNAGTNLGCIDKKQYAIQNAIPGNIIKAEEWETLKQALNVEEERRAKSFQDSNSKSSYYKNVFFTSLKRKIGDIIRASEFNTLVNITKNLGAECACNCAYCTCNCNYCTCNCAYCPCNCNNCTCNCNHECICNCAY